MPRIGPRLCILAALLALGGCAGTVVNIRDGQPSNTRDGKCNGPDYNASSCVYLF